MYPHPKKLLLLDILEVLKRHSDENHRLKQNEIRHYLEQDYGLVGRQRDDNTYYVRIPT